MEDSESLYILESFQDGEWKKVLEEPVKGFFHPVSIDNIPGAMELLRCYRAGHATRIFRMAEYKRTNFTI